MAEPAPDLSSLEVESDRFVSGSLIGVSYAGITHRGLHRKRNEDSFWVDEDQRLFVVADGMGGHRRGAEAARSAVTTIGQSLESGPTRVDSWLPPARRLRRRIKRAYGQAHAAVREATEDGGSTADMLWVRESTALIGHLGDSRIYLFRDGVLQQVTADHTVAVDRARRRGVDRARKVGAEQPPRNDREGSLLTRVLGPGHRPRPDCLELELRPGDCFLMCSDGLSGLVDDGPISTLLSRHGGDLPSTCLHLLAAALDRGGTDNVTVVLVSVDSV